MSLSGPWTPVDAAEVLLCLLSPAISLLSSHAFSLLSSHSCSHARVFEGPGTTNAVSGGTAAFYKVELKVPHPDTGSKGYFIAKDLAHAVDEVRGRAEARRQRIPVRWAPGTATPS